MRTFFDDMVARSASFSMSATQTCQCTVKSCGILQQQTSTQRVWYGTATGIQVQRSI